MGQYKYLVYSFTAALTIAGCTFYIGVQFGVGYISLIATITFFFAFFTYTIDHYFDAQDAVKNIALHSRHKVNDANYKMAIKGIALTAICALYFFYYLPRPFLYCGLALATVSGLYFLLIFKTKLSQFWKQVFSAVILTLVMGIWILVYSQEFLRAVYYLSIVLVAVWTNLLTIGYLDTSYDQQIKPENTFFKWNRNKVLIVLLCAMLFIFLLGYVIELGQFWMFVPLVYGIVLLASKKEQKQISDFKRIAIDLILLLPLIKFFF